MTKLCFDPESLNEQRNVSELPTYGISEVAHYLRMPQATLRSWVLGRNYPTEAGVKRFKPLIKIADRKRGLLSFINFAEAHVLNACRRQHNLSMDRIRRALDYVAKAFHSEHPLIEAEFETNGVALFVNNLFGKLVDASASGQTVIRDLVHEHLRRLERNGNQIVRLYPFTRPEAVDSPRSVLIDPRVSFGRPILASAGIPTASLAERYSAGETIDHLAEDYGCERLEIEEAIRYEFGTYAAAA